MSPMTHYPIILLLLTSILGDAQLEVIGSADKTKISIHRKGCDIPTSGDYYYLSLEGNKLDRRKCYDGSGQFAFRVYCLDPTRIIEPDSFAICFDGLWYPSKHTCVQRTCEPVYDTFSTHHKCTTNKGIEVDCRLPAVPGTKITIRCAHWRYEFKNSKIRVIEKFCKRNGEWQTLEECEQSCSSVPQNLIAKNINYRAILDNNYPWNVVIYRYKDGGWNQHCSGTLVSASIVFTAKYCMSDDSDGRLDLNTRRIAVGKYFKNYSDYNQDQLYDVMNVENSELSSFSIIQVSKYIEVNNAVGPLCRHYNAAKVLNDKVGHIVTWAEDGSQSALQLQYMTIEHCRASIDISGRFPSDGPFLCSLTNNHTFSTGELGGGLIISQFNEDYLVGVLVDLIHNGRIPIFLDIGESIIDFYIDRVEDYFINLNRKKKGYEYLFRRRGNY